MPLGEKVIDGLIKAGFVLTSLEFPVLLSAIQPNIKDQEHKWQTNIDKQPLINGLSMRPV